MTKKKGQKRAAAKKGGKTERKRPKKTAKKEGIDPRFVAAYAWHRAGVPISEICKKFKRGKTVIYDWIKRVKAIVETPMDIEELKNITLALSPLALEALTHNLKKKKEVTVNNYLNKTIFSDVKDSEFRSETNIFNITGGFEGLLGEDEIRFLEAVRDHIGQSNTAPTAPQVASRFKLPPERKE